MTGLPQTRMNAEAFLAWAAGRPGRYELLDGTVVAMSPQRVRHARTKFQVQTALTAAIRAGGLPCEMLADGIGVAIDAWTRFEPDALVACGEPLDPDAVTAAAPVVVVEVLSPGTRAIDTGRKLEGYFRVPGLAHYLIVEPRRPMVIHHRRGRDGGIETTFASTGALVLDPPGLTLDVEAFFPDV